MSMGYAPTTLSSSRPLFSSSKRSGPPRVLVLRKNFAGLSPPAVSRSGKPSPSQSNVATPPPTMYCH
jgi:hypothetical protein